MVKIKKFIWIFPLFGGIITLLSFLAPAAYFYYQSSTYNTEFYRWMMDFYVSHVYEAGTHTTTIGLNTNVFGFISLTSSLIIMALSVISIISVIKFKKGTLESKNIWLISSLSTIIITIGWMIIKEIYTLIRFNHSFWGLLSPSFGIIGPFIGAGLEIVGFLLIKKYR